MRDLRIPALITCGAIFLSLLQGCKTRRPTIDIESRSGLQAGFPSVEDENDPTVSYLKVSDFKFPGDPSPYTRISLLLKSPGKEDVLIPNYDLQQKVSLEVGVRYSLIVTLYANGQAIYSNDCKKSKEFTAVTGSNFYSIPICLLTNLPPVESLPKKLPDSSSTEGEAEEIE